MDDSLRFPIGKAMLPEQLLDVTERTKLIQQVAELPARLTALAREIGGERLQLPYRPGGWNGREVIHHLADSHMNSYVRYRLALTEENPTIKPYDETAWTELPDIAATPITVSLGLLEALHTRWVTMMHHMSEEQWRRTFYHPGLDRDFRLDQALALYAWHGQHHLAHLQMLLPKA